MAEFRPEDLEEAIVRILTKVWHFIRLAQFNLSFINADDVYQTVDPDHLGTPASMLDRLTHQMLESTVHAELSDLLGYVIVGGEEASAANRALSSRLSRFIVLVDAIDGTAQLEALGVGWGSVIAIQAFRGFDDAGAPRFETVAGGVVNSNGDLAVHVRDQRTVELRQVVVFGEEATLGGSFSTRQSISIESPTQEAGAYQPAMALTGYKERLWSAFDIVRRQHPDHVVFNTAGAPLTPTVLLRNALAAAQPMASTIWDAIGAYLVSAAGGVVMLVDGDRPLSRREVQELFDVSPFVIGSDGRSKWAKPIPAYVIGSDFGQVAALSRSLGAQAASP